MNSKLGQVRKDAATGFFKVVYQHSSADTGKLWRTSEEAHPSQVRHSKNIVLHCTKPYHVLQ